MKYCIDKNLSYQTPLLLIHYTKHNILLNYMSTNRHKYLFALVCHTLWRRWHVLDVIAQLKVGVGKAKITERGAHLIMTIGLKIFIDFSSSKIGILLESTIVWSDAFFSSTMRPSPENTAMGKLEQTQNHMIKYIIIISCALYALLTCELRGCSSHWRSFHKCCKNRQSAPQNVSPPHGFSLRPSACLIFHRSCR